MDTKGIIDIVQELDGRGIFVVVFSDELEIPFRLPPVREARRYAFLLQSVSSELSQAEIYYRIFKRCCCDQSIFEHNFPAGIGETTAKLIMWLSGYGDEPIRYTQELMNEHRGHVEKFHQTMKRTICSIFKSYTFEDLEQLDYPTLVEVFVQAEKVLLEAGIIKEEHQIETSQPKSSGKIDVDALIEDQRRGLREVDGPPQMRRLQRGETPGMINTNPPQRPPNPPSPPGRRPRRR